MRRTQTCRDGHSYALPLHAPQSDAPELPPGVNAPSKEQVRAMVVLLHQRSWRWKKYFSM